MKFKRAKKFRLASDTYVAVCDPSMSSGWGGVILNQNDVIMDTLVVKVEGQAKKLRIRKGDDDIRRIEFLNQKIIKFFKDWGVKAIFSELPHGSQNARGAKLSGVVAAQLQMYSDITGVPIEWFSEGDAKKQLFGRASATKEETIHAIDKLYDVAWTTVEYKDEAIADALAIHNCARAVSPLLKMIRNG